MAAPKKKVPEIKETPEIPVEIPKPRVKAKRKKVVKRYVSVKYTMRNPFNGLRIDKTPIPIPELDSWTKCQIKAGYIKEVK